MLVIVAVVLPLDMAMRPAVIAAVIMAEIVAMAVAVVAGRPIQPDADEIVRRIAAKYMMAMFARGQGGAGGHYAGAQ